MSPKREIKKNSSDYTSVPEQDFVSVFHRKLLISSKKQQCNTNYLITIVTKDAHENLKKTEDIFHRHFMHSYHPARNICGYLSLLRPKYTVYCPAPMFFNLDLCPVAFR